MKSVLAGFAGALLACVCVAQVQAGPRGKASHVVVIVWDGMRPDFVSENNTPTLWRLARDGVFFRKHHAVFLSSTEVNGLALATGAYPNRNGIMANREFRPDIDPLQAIDTQDEDAVRRGGENYIARRTIPEILQQAGFRTVIAGTKGVTLLFDRATERTNTASKKSVTLFQGNTLPDAARANLVSVLGPWPALLEGANAAQDTWTTQALTQHFWKDDVPVLSLLWLSEPDLSQHRTAPGSNMAITAMKSSDARLAEVLAVLEAKKLRNKTDIFIVSDHGFSTMSESVDVPAVLNAAGFRAFRNKFESAPQRGDVLVVGNGGTVLFYVIDLDEAVTRRLVEFLQQSNFAGVIFTRLEIEGTFKLASARLDTPAAPDVVMAFRWTDEKNKFGAPGMIAADWTRKPGQGTHATLSSFDLHNLLIVAGPDFQRGTNDELPTGNIDLAPTILWILGVQDPQGFDGRVLFEAMTHGSRAGLEASISQQEAVRDFERTRWRQYLKSSQVSGTFYIDEGNGKSTSR